MEAVILDGKALAEKIRSELKARVEELKAKHGIVPNLATILVGGDPSSATYVKMKGKACESVGMLSEKIHLPEETTTAQLLHVIDALNGRKDIHGILLQHPVPHQIDERAAFDRIALAKDVDGVTTLGFARTCFSMPAFQCCTPAGIIRLMQEYNIPFEGKHAVVVGRSAILGRPLAEMLLNRNCTVTVCHSRTKDLQRHLGMADIVVGALGKPNFIRGESLREGVVVVDAGYNAGNVGDCHYESCFSKASYITPVPGGVGPMTIAILLEQTVRSAEREAG